MVLRNIYEKYKHCCTICDDGDMVSTIETGDFDNWCKITRFVCDWCGITDNVYSSFTEEEGAEINKHNLD